MLYAEATAAPTIKKAYVWSPIQSKSAHEIKYWTMRIKVLKSVPVHPAVLAAIHSKSGLPATTSKSMPMATLVNNLHQAKA
jgi:hypothetical protein